ncbi:DUF805 domain-containing protein [Rothia terrae]|uniref:DUF805 domain-containing protein n=1 Tax=Rothia terrae TaxID=396015 RepID=A0A7H2BFI3_9MICC|nr:DUF805 domain-containing protein [Rothia terrae]QNV38429.1 DUF805 domain-containing protein [Rothia terrae]
MKNHLIAQPGTTLKTALSRWRKNLFVFQGTASRSEFWKVIGLWLVAWIVVNIVAMSVWIYTLHFLATNPPSAPTGSIWEERAFQVWLGIVTCYGLFWLLFTILNAGLGARRLQDAGTPGWVFWFCLIPPGLTVVLILCALPSQIQHQQQGYTQQGR